ncbi:MAG: hypothetical protein RIR00_2406 [Pseudomonadota bacterium]|jgi:adenine-specific DNA-methyltransferase
MTALLAPDVAQLGQVFTPDTVVQAMLALRRNSGRVLEPACGDGAFSRHLPGCVAVELDSAQAPAGAWIGDFFAYPASERFATIIGNPPYVRYQDILPATRARLKSRLFDARSNLYLFFIEKAVRQLAPGGELIFITPRDFLKATASIKLNPWLLQQGAFTDVIELGDAKVFPDAVPNCLIWRFEKDREARNLRYAEIGYGNQWAAQLAAPAWEERDCVECGGHLLFLRGHYPLRLGDLAEVKVGAVSGADDIYRSDSDGNRDFVCSETVKTGATRRMIWCDPDQPAPDCLLPHKARLLARRVQHFDERNWWHWGRGYPQSTAPRVYVNTKTRQAQAFFLHPCTHFDGAVMGIFPKRTDLDLAAFCAALNTLDWGELGFICDGRFLFTQRSLLHAPLPDSFRAFLPETP